MSTGKLPAKETEVSRDQALLAQVERAVFGDLPTNNKDGQLTEPELWWSQHYHWLRDSGYLLRPRYTPDWTPSWQGTKENWVLCEDSCVAQYATRILDGTRVSDSTFVTLKLVNKTYHPHEIDIARYFSSQPLAMSANHCVPVYDVLPVPDEEDRVIIVMPLLQDYLRPPFHTIGEAVECFRQLFEGLQFMHKHRVVHRDCSSRNIMMDPTKLYLDAFHPVSPLMKRDFSGYARYKTRTERPPKYFFIDFGLSRRYDPSVATPMEDPIWGADKEVPEFQNSNAPCDPFPTDVFYIGNAIKKDFVEKDPSKRPTMDEVVQRFAAIRAGLSTWKLRSRIVSKGERVYQSVTRGTFHWIRRIGFITRGIPAVPTPA
ncbi:kinase-like domain-containing protein [Butyriboletus roseoflavus]|nr:kinase-like domain-containing protein [Butyriboletus roseoflavus]